MAKLLYDHEGFDILGIYKSKEDAENDLLKVKPSACDRKEVKSFMLGEANI